MPEGSVAIPNTETTYKHHEAGIKEMEKRYNDRYPVLHHPVKSLKVTTFYSPDKVARQEAVNKYHKGKALPPVTINDNSEISDNHHLWELAKEFKLSHVPVIVTGNPSLKKDLECKLRQVPVLGQEDTNGNK